MGRILDKLKYEVKEQPVIQDYFVGSDSENLGKTVNFEIASVISTVSGTGEPDRIVSGTPVWIVDTLNFYIPTITYYLGGLLLYTEPETITLDAGDGDDPRIDVIAVTSDSTVVIIKGTPAPTPSKPTLPNGNDYLELTFVTIDTGGTTPSTATSEAIYDDFLGEPNEYTVSTTGTSPELRIQLDNETNPYKGTKCIYVVSPKNTDSIIFLNDALTPINEADNLVFAIRLDLVLPKKGRLYFSFYKEGSVISDVISLKHNAYNLNSNLLYEYQLISIPFSDFTFTDTDFDSIHIDFNNLSSGVVFRLDAVDRIIGIEQPPINEIYELPIATASVLGGVKIGTGINVDVDGIISVTAYSLPIATASVLGGVKIGTGIDVDVDGIISVTAYSLPIATASVLGGVKIGTGIDVDVDGIISVTAYSLPIATASVLGGVKVDGTTITITGGGVISAVPEIDVIEEDATVTGTKNIDWSYDTFVYTITGIVTFADTNLPAAGKSKTITIHVTGDFAITYPAGWTTYISGAYDGTVFNTIVVEYVASSTPFFKVQISQPD